MRRTSIRVLVLTAVAVAGVVLVVIRALDAQGHRLPPVAWVEDVALVGLSAVIFWLGWTVRAYQKGNKPSLGALRAARTLVLAKAGALTGAILTGRYLAAVLDVVGDLSITAQRDRAIAAGIAMVCAILLTVVSLVVERFCELPPPDDDAERDGNHGPEALPG